MQVELLQAGGAWTAVGRLRGRQAQRLALQQWRAQRRAGARSKQQRKVAADAGRKVRGGGVQRGVPRACDGRGQQQAQHIALCQQLRARLDADVRHASRVHARRGLRMGGAHTVLVGFQCASGVALFFSTRVCHITEDNTLMAY